MVWIFPYFMKEPAKSALNARIAPSAARRGPVKLRTYDQVVNHLIRTYATDDIIADTEADIDSFKQPQNKTASEYADLLHTKTLRAGAVYSDYRLKGLFIEGLHDSVRQNVRAYYTEHTKADIGALARYATSVLSLRRDHTTPGSSSHRPTTGRRDAILAVTPAKSTTDSSYGGSQSGTSDRQSAVLNDLLLLQRRMTGSERTSNVSRPVTSEEAAQEQPDSSLQPIGYWSGTLTKLERAYDTTQRECLAIVWAVLKLRP